MSTRIIEWDERTFDLALEELTTGLGHEERDELVESVDADELRLLEQCVVALDLAGLQRLDEPPAELMLRIERDARAHFALARHADRTVPIAPRRAKSVIKVRTAILTGTSLLAAALLLAFLWLRGATDRTKEPADRRDILLADARDVVRAPWVATADPFAGGVRGDVVWSGTRQEGYLSFAGLPRNDPRANQYQLWIFDKSRAEWDAKPVDGGVFDVGPGGNVVVPIDAKLEIRQPALFAVTLEAPGGVVVSKREHLLATATP